MIECRDFIIIRRKAKKSEIKAMATHFKGYIKVVVDIKKRILAGGSERHFDDEQVLLHAGSAQKDLWGGGLDLETGEIDYNSVINLRPNQDNPSRDIMSKDIRKKIDQIVKDLLL